MLSIVFVWAPVSGSTKFTEWFTIRWEKPLLFRELYAFQQSEITVVPGKIFSLIIDTRVLAVRSATHLKKHSLVSLCIPPKTQTPSTLLPLWNFLFPNLDSSISTTLPGPSICRLYYQDRYTDFSWKIVPIEYRCMRDAQLVFNKFLFCSVNPEVGKEHHCFKGKVTLWEPGSLSNWHLLTTCFVRTTPATLVSTERRVLSQAKPTFITKFTWNSAQF